MKNRLCLSAAFVALLGIGACAATSPSANAQSNSAPAIGRGGCYSPNLSLVNANWDSIAQTCGAQILQTRDIRDATYARYYTGRALVELGQRPENRAQAGRFFEEAMGHLQRAIEDEQILDANEKPFHAARLELARALSGLGRYDEALAKLAEIERDTTATRNPRLAMTGVRAKIARGAILESRAGPPEGPIETRDLRNAISAYEDAVRDAAQPLPQPDYSRMKRKERQAAEAVAKAFDAERNSLKVEAERLLLTSSQRLANTALARSGALVEPNPQERTNDRRSLGDASDALRSAIAVIDAARLQSSTGNAGNLSNADISATYVARGKVELLLAGYEGAASRPDFGCASGAGDPNRVDTALQSFNSALRDSGLSGAIAADAYAGRGCALQASSAMDAYARSAQLSDAE
ncbi:MAG: hypothetical protein R3C55_00015, partial [Parvularculaceae bacterium]